MPTHPPQADLAFTMPTHPPQADLLTIHPEVQRSPCTAFARAGSSVHNADALSAGELQPRLQAYRELWLTVTQDAGLFSVHSAETFSTSKNLAAQCINLKPVASFYLDDPLSQGLIYCDPSRDFNFWRPTPSALLTLGLRSSPTSRRSKSSRSGSTRRKKFARHYSEPLSSLNWRSIYAGGSRRP